MEWPNFLLKKNRFKFIFLCLAIFGLRGFLGNKSILRMQNGKHNLSNGFNLDHWAKVKQARRHPDSFETVHQLEFASAPYPQFFEDEIWDQYRIGTVKGLWRCEDQNYEILSFINDEPSNGHLEDVFQWFEFACQRDGRNLVIRSVFNRRFYRHLMYKRGFVPFEGSADDLIKIINQ